MPNYAQTLTLPDFRNLAINPGAEEIAGATWSASNGIVGVGRTVVTPRNGAAHGLYRVATSTTDSYHFGPLGPQGDSFHQGLFAIPTATKAVSAKIYVKADRAVWVRMYARYLVSARNAASEQLELKQIDFQPMGSPVSLTAASEWTLLNGRDTTTATGATHWQPVVAVFSQDPTGSSTALAPTVGTEIYFDEALVSETGADVFNYPFIDGSSSSRDQSYSEGLPRYSSSRTGQAPVAGTVSDGATDYVAPTPTVVGNETSNTPVVPTGAAPPPITPIVVPDTPQPIDPNAPVETAAVEDPSDRAKLTFRYRASPQELCMRADVQLSDLIMNTVDEQGVVWVVSDIEGWWSIPEVDVPDQPRAWFDGSYETRGRYLARNVTLNGSFIPRSVDDVAAARDRLIRAASLCHVGGWLLTHQDATSARADTRGSKMWLNGAPSIATVAANGRTDFSIGLRAPDPLKYGIKGGLPPGYEKLVIGTEIQVDYPGRMYPKKYPWSYPKTDFGLSDVQAVNRGNAVVSPIVTVKGPTSGPVVVKNLSTQQDMRIARKLFPREELVIECASKQVSLNGVGNARFYLDVNADWLMLQPGPNRLRLVDETPGVNKASAEIQWRSGWIG